MERIERFFRIREHGTTVGTELRAGLATFLTMAYILAVNPQMLSLTGMPVGDVTVATALGAAVATMLMGIWANYPVALAPGMGLNAYFTFGVVMGMGVSWQVALTAVFVEGLIFIGLSFGGIRTALIRAFPASIRLATAGGIGLFLALIGMKSAGLVVANEATLVALGDLRSPQVLLSLLGLVGISVMVAAKVKGAILIGIAAITILAWTLGLAPAPEGIFSLPSLPETTFWAFDWSQVLTAKFFTVVFAFLFVDIFDTAGTLLGVGRLGGLLTPQGELPRASKAFASDAVGTSVGAIFGTSTVTSYVESGAGVEEGGRTGLTAVTVGVLFLLALFFVPVIVAVPAIATAPALIVVGAMMVGAIKDLDWKSMDEAIPAFLTIVMMPFTYSIAHGIVFGLVSYVLVKALAGKWKDLNPMLVGVAVVLAVYYAFLK